MESHANNQYETGYYYYQNKKTAEKAIIIASIIFWPAPPVLQKQDIYLNKSDVAIFVSMKVEDMHINVFK